jgi:hypothetical protein
MSPTTNSAPRFSSFQIDALHLHQIDQAGEIALDADRQMHHRRLRARRSMIMSTQR